MIFENFATALILLRKFQNFQKSIQAIYLQLPYPNMRLLVQITQLSCQQCFSEMTITSSQSGVMKRYLVSP